MTGFAAVRSISYINANTHCLHTGAGDARGAVQYPARNPGTFLFLTSLSPITTSRLGSEMLFGSNRTTDQAFNYLLTF